MIFSVPEGHVAIQERWGAFEKVLEPGQHIYNPLSAAVKTVPDWGNSTNKWGWAIEMADQHQETGTLTCQTRNHVAVKAAAAIYWRITDVKKAVYAVDSLPVAVNKLALNVLRSKIATMELDEVFTGREAISKALTDATEKVSKRWGIEFWGLEIRELAYTDDVSAAMQKKVKAERDREVQILQADGKAQAAIKQAEATAAVARITAENEREAAILRSDAQAQAAIKAAEARAAVERIEANNKAATEKIQTEGVAATNRIRAEGEAATKKIQAETASELVLIGAEAQAKAETIAAEAQAKAKSALAIAEGNRLAALVNALDKDKGLELLLAEQRTQAVQALSSSPNSKIVLPHNMSTLLTGQALVGQPYMTQPVLGLSISDSSSDKDTNK